MQINFYVIYAESFLCESFVYSLNSKKASIIMTQLNYNIVVLNYCNNVVHVRKYKNKSKNKNYVIAYLISKKKKIKL